MITRTGQSTVTGYAGGALVRVRPSLSAVAAVVASGHDHDVEEGRCRR
jgi:hypothetical protein